MAYDEGLAQRIREALADQPGVTEKKMFGGLAFMWRGHMVCGVTKERLMVRVGPEQYKAALAEPHASEMNLNGRPMKGMVFVNAEGVGTDETLEGWVQRAIRFNATLPPK